MLSNRLLIGFALIWLLGQTVNAQNSMSVNLAPIDKEMVTYATEVRDSVTKIFQQGIRDGEVTEKELFSMLYFPDTALVSTPHFSTFYDKFTDRTIQKLLDNYLLKNANIVAVVIMDRNCYMPTHNSKFSTPYPNDKTADFMNYRTKRIFNDKIGLRAAKNTDPYLIQEYHRDTGEEFAEVAVPIFISDRHWGTVRIAYKK
ncbi:MAG: chemotaxis protein [Bacteroidetes bacterium]|nr:chemotaxis protein [Bacteroidota bacterium]MBU1720433.1 chemotaxis protein [Bacteroidota bacterium]